MARSGVGGVCGGGLNGGGLAVGKGVNLTLLWVGDWAQQKEGLPQLLLRMGVGWVGRQGNVPTFRVSATSSDEGLRSSGVLPPFLMTPPHRICRTLYRVSPRHKPGVCARYEKPRERWPTPSAATNDPCLAHREVKRVLYLPCPPLSSFKHQSHDKTDSKSCLSRSGCA